MAPNVPGKKLPQSRYVQNKERLLPICFPLPENNRDPPSPGVLPFPARDAKETRTEAAYEVINISKDSRNLLRVAILTYK